MTDFGQEWCLSGHSFLRLFLDLQYICRRRRGNMILRLQVAKYATQIGRAHV